MNLRHVCTTFVILYASFANAVDIKVLIAADIESQTLNSNLHSAILSNLNLAMMNGNLSQRFSLAFSSTYSSTCASTVASPQNPNTILDCAETELGVVRDTVNADIVLLVTRKLSGAWCGQANLNVNETHYNPLWTFSVSNRQDAYAVVDFDCLVDDSNLSTHETGHILYLEHDAGDPLTSFPVSDNHGFGTVAGQKSIMWLGTEDKAAYFSQAGEVFPGTTEPLGMSGSADSRNVVNDHSWDVVSAYRPLPPDCSLEVHQLQCSGPNTLNSATATMPGGYTIEDILYEVVLGGGAGNPQVIYEGPPTCPAFSTPGSSIVRAVVSTAAGISNCEIYVPSLNCDINDW